MANKLLYPSMSRQGSFDMTLQLSAFALDRNALADYPSSGTTSPSGLYYESDLTRPPKSGATTPAPLDAKIYTLESRARSLRHALDAVEAELAAARCARGRIHNASQPSCRLPESMLADIFQLALDTCYIPHSHDDTSSSSSSVQSVSQSLSPSQKRRNDEWALLRAITSTNAHWRSVALNAPRLWCRVEARLGHFDAKFRSFLERSRAAPLHITLHIDSPYHSSHNRSPSASSTAGTDTPSGRSSTATKLRTWIRALAYHLERAQTLVLRSKDQSAAEALFPFPARLPLLRTFKWVTTARENDTPVPRNWLEGPHPRLLDMDMSQCTLLETVKIQRKGFGPALLFDWDPRVLQNLKTLFIEGWAGFPDIRLIQLIQQCTSLKALVWIRAVDSLDEPHPEEDITDVPQLVSESVEVLRVDLTIHSQIASDTFKQAHFPMLRHITIYSGDNARIDLADQALLGPVPTTSPLLATNSNTSNNSNTHPFDTPLPTPPLPVQTYKTRFPNVQTAWLSLFTFSPSAVLNFLDAHPSLHSFGCALRPAFVDLITSMSEPASVVPWVVKGQNVRGLYVICASVSWDAEPQGEELIGDLCHALRELIMLRRAGTHGHEAPKPISSSLSSTGGFPFFHGKRASRSLAGSLPGTPMSGYSVEENMMLGVASSAQLSSSYPFASSIASSLSSSYPIASSPLASPGMFDFTQPNMNEKTKTQIPVGLLPAAFTVQINDHTWRDPSRINSQYLKLKDEFPENVILSGENDDPPAYFRHVV